MTPALADPPFITAVEAAYWLGVGKQPVASDIAKICEWREKRETYDHLGLIVACSRTIPPRTTEEQRDFHETAAKLRQWPAEEQVRVTRFLEQFDQGEKTLIQAHVERSVTLTGRCREGARLGKRQAIPNDYFADSVKLNVRTNHIGPDGTVADFQKFEDSQSLIWWEDVQLARAEVQALVKSLTGSAESSIGAQMRCERWLIEQMQASKHRLHSKFYYRDDATQKFNGLSDRGFNKAWDGAIKETGAVEWRKSGKIPKQKTPGSTLTRKTPS